MERKRLRCNWSSVGPTIALVFLLLASCPQSAIAQSNTFPASGNVGIGTTAPEEKLVTVGNAVVGSITSHTQLYSGYDTQTPSILEVGYGTATSSITPFASLVLSKNATGTAQYIGSIFWANRSIADGGEKRLVQIAVATDGATNSGLLIFNTTNAGTIAERMRIDHLGNVGVGTTNPSEKLDVSGNIKVTGTGNITATGTISGGTILAKYQDVAEWVPSTHALPAGTVVTLDPTKSNHVEASSQAYDTRVAGVISMQPGIVLGERGENKVLVATTGRVRIKVDASHGPIQVGDLFVTSGTPGLAMKSQPINVGGVQIHRPGTLIGKALEPLAKGRGEILVLLSLQ